METWVLQVILLDLVSEVSMSASVGYKTAGPIEIKEKLSCQIILLLFK